MMEPVLIPGWTQKELAILRGHLAVSAIKLCWEVKHASLGEQEAVELEQLCAATAALAEV